MLAASPAKLLLIATGNIGNPSLIDLFVTHSGTIIQALEVSDFVELTTDRVILHD